MLNRSGYFGFAAVRMLRILIVLSSLAAASCASIPFSTLARMSSFDEKDFSSLDASVVRVKVSLLEHFKLDVGKCVLKVEVKSGERSRIDAMELKADSVTPGIIPGEIFSSPKSATVYVMSLADSSRQKFIDLQNFVRSAKVDAVNLNVNVALLSVPKDAVDTQVWVDLLFSESAGYFRLIDAGTIRLDRGRSQVLMRDP
jgi:hypothetical protein